MQCSCQRRGSDNGVHRLCGGASSRVPKLRAQCQAWAVQGKGRRFVGNIDDLPKYLRTSAVHGLRSVFVDGQPQLFPLLEHSYRVPITYRALSRRESGVLQMISRGMSNKCIAKSLGIAPETVKSHVKRIFSKLKARTRAQAVARAEASTCFEHVQVAGDTTRSGASPYGPHANYSQTLSCPP